MAWSPFWPKDRMARSLKVLPLPLPYPDQEKEQERPDRKRSVRRFSRWQTATAAATAAAAVAAATRVFIDPFWWKGNLIFRFRSLLTLPRIFFWETESLGHPLALHLQSNSDADHTDIFDNTGRNAYLVALFDWFIFYQSSNSRFFIRSIFVFDS